MSYLIGFFAAFLIGLSKTGVPGVGLASVAMMVYAFPGLEKQSSGAVLPLLILGDIFAVCYHTRDVHWKRLRGLFPPVLLGLIFGGYVLQRIDNTQVRVLLGGLIVALLIGDLIRSRLKWDALPKSRVFAWSMGLLAGFTTLIGNAAGPVMSVYMASQNLSKDRFMGTWCWFFFCVNLSKIPFMVGLVYPDLQMITLQTLRFDLAMIPAVVLGAIVGRRVYSLIPESRFVGLVLLLNVIPGIEMLVRPLL